jgi:hypothetical protein
VTLRDQFCFITVAASCVHGEIKESFFVAIYYSPVKLIQTYQIQQIWPNIREICVFSLQMDALRLLYRSLVTDKGMNEAGTRVTAGGERQGKTHDKLCGKRNGCNGGGWRNEWCLEGQRSRRNWGG